MFRPSDIDKFNDDVKQWTEDVKEEAKDELDFYGVQHSKNSRSSQPLKNAIKTKQVKRAGVTVKTSFSIPRHSVFLHKGVGRGTPIGSVGNTARKAKPWLNPPIERNFHKLQDIVGSHQGNFVLNAIIIK